MKTIKEVELEEENKRLKDLCNKYEEEHKTTFEYWKHLIKEDYKTRIDKAIEYNKKNIHSQTLSNILKGSDNNENIFK